MSGRSRRAFLRAAALTAGALPSLSAAPVPKRKRPVPLGPLLDELTAAYRQLDERYADGLHPPATSADIAATGEEVGYPFPQELADLYRLHDGQAYQRPGVTGVFGAHRLHTLREVVQFHRMYTEPLGPGQPFQDCPKFPPGPNVEGYYHRRLLPIASWDVYTLCVDAETGGVWEFSPNSGVWATSHLPSIAAAWQALLAQMKAGRRRPALYLERD